MSREEIEQLKYDLIDIGSRIIHSDHLIMQIKDSALREYYKKQLVYLIDMYRELESLLKTSINDFIKYENEHGNLIDFTLRKLQRDLKK
jgi:hypothetical protein